MDDRFGFGINMSRNQRTPQKNTDTVVEVKSKVSQMHEQFVIEALEDVDPRSGAAG